ncbi:DUF6065 family protein [Pseudomonadota bacterium]
MSKGELTAYLVSTLDTPIRPGERDREWMDQTQERFAYRCLPLIMGNMLGWDILCPVSFEARWNGGDAPKATRIKFDGKESKGISSHFGHGIVTFSLDYLFRTPKGHNLIVKGPPNRFKDGIAPLEALVETDWTPSTFTMNWKFTRKRMKVRFTKGEPICRILPYPRNYIEQFECKIEHIADNPGLYEEYMAWRRSREAFNSRLGNADPGAVMQGWEKDYMVGKRPTGEKAEQHQSKLRLREFEG